MKLSISIHRIIGFIIYFSFSILLVSAQNNTPKYVFLFIGDGMGLAQVHTTEVFMESMKGKIGDKKLRMNTFPVQSLMTTYALNRNITGSAAAGTAIASGFKTSINTIGMDSAKKKPLISIAEMAHQKGMKVGIISTVSLNHATPAAFYAHQPERDLYYEIASEIPASGFEFFGGGGLYQPKGKNKDLPDVFESLKASGYSLLTGKRELKNLKPTNGKVFVMNTRLGKGAEMPYTIDRDTCIDFSLADITSKAIEYLNNPKGFFMMIEGGMIDWAGHSNDAATIIHEVMDLDNAVDVAYRFYLKHPRETLIIVTADHETGGLALGWAGKKYALNLNLLATQKASHYELENAFKAYYSEYCKKGCSYDDVLKHFYPVLGLHPDSLNEAEKDMIWTAFKASIYKSMPYADKKLNDAIWGSNDPLSNTAIKILNQKAGIGWTSWSHTGTPVPLMAIGAGSHLFDAYLDNTDIVRHLRQLWKMNSSKGNK
ncbi:MAG: alkaline phosphatase [Bacteroidales bacterium]|nr:alkaline phosphatase [Bacteroidales bacterium]